MVSIDYDRSTLTLRMPFHAECVNQFKSAIPQQARQWDPDEKAWYFNASFFPQLLHVLRRFFSDSDIYISEEVPGYLSLADLLNVSVPQNQGGPYGELFLTPNAPPELVKFVYRKLARMYHPDTGKGDLEKMKRLNLAYEKLTSN